MVEATVDNSRSDFDATPVAGTALYRKPALLIEASEKKLFMVRGIRAGNGCLYRERKPKKINQRISHRACVKRDGFHSADHTVFERITAIVTAA